jgi:hypothetical protein
VNAQVDTRQLQIVLRKDSACSENTVSALAGILGVSSQEITLRKVDKKSCIFDLEISETAMQQLRSNLQANNGRLRLLGIDTLILEQGSGQFESWAIDKGVFELETIVDRSPLDSSDNDFVPIPGIWQFHVAYLVVTSILGVAAFPYSQFASLLLISGVCAVGIILAFSRYSVVAYILALAIVFASPIVVFAGLLPVQTVILFLLLILGATLAHKYLF